MATPPMEYLNSMWQYVPQGHEKPLKQAFYNTVANIFLVFAAGVGVAVYFILSPFLRPLYWAVLCGTFLYPFKRSLTNLLRNWLKGLHTSGTPLAVGIAVLPLQVANNAAETLTEGIWPNLKLLLGVFFGLPAIYLLYYFGPLQKIILSLQSTLSFLYDFLGYFSSLWVWSLFVAYFLAVVFFWTPSSQKWLKGLSFPVWIAVLLHIVTVAGSLRVPLLIFLVIIMAVGFFLENKKANNIGEGDSASHHSQSFWEKIHSLFGVQTSCQGDDTMDKHDVSDNAEAEGKSVLLEQSPVISSPPPAATKPMSLNLGTDKTSASKQQTPMKTEDSKSSTPSSAKEGALSLQYFKALIWAHVIVRLWMHFWFIFLLMLLPIVHIGMKWLWKQFIKEGGLYDQLRQGPLQQWMNSRQDVLMPKILRNIGHLLLKGDNKLVAVLEKGVDNATSILFILMLLVGTMIFSIIATVQIQRESMYMLTSTQNILNKTVNSEFAMWLPKADEMHETIDQVLQKTHEYGRNFIASKVKEFVETDKENQDNLVNQVLEVWDRAYEAWLTKSATNQSSTNEKSSSVIPEIPNVDTLWQTMGQIQGFFHMGTIVEFVKENLGMLMSVLESVWLVLKGNMNLVMSIVTSILSAVLGGGTAILNFVISAVIFLTTMFYLLASSGDVYKPVELFSSISPGSSGSGFGQAVEEAISGVFMASLKMAAFYGLYTWLIHLIFGLDIVFIPTALASMFAAVPFLGPYWAALPAVIELWLVQGQGLMAILCFVAHMIPSYVVDTAIYSEIKGGHPYVTGLAIAGGIYCMGLEGAIIGPIILCCLIVLVNMYGNMLTSDSSTPTPTRMPFNLRTMMARSQKQSGFQAARSVSSDSMCVPQIQM